jgi:hypothetical protein
MEWPTGGRRASALAGFEAAIGLVDDVDAALAPHQPVVAVSGTQRFQRVTDFHDDLWMPVWRAF